MSRLAKWKLEKTKVKVVFRLQFHATHIPQTGWDKLFISFIPADTGKATGKTNKANVRNGTCKWGDPIYETTRLLQDAKTKQFDEKLYKFVVSMGTSRSSILGETTINLADYADALKPFDVALPLRGCDSETILHVTIQLLTSKTGFREFEQQRDLREKGFRTTTDQSNHNESASGKISMSEMHVNGHTDKGNAKVRSKSESKDHPLLPEVVLNEEYADSAVGFDGSSNTSESMCIEKHETSSTHEFDGLKSTASGDIGERSLSQSPRPMKGNLPDHRLISQGSNDWVHGWGSDYSIDNDLSVTYEENTRLRASLEVAEASIIELKFEVSSLQNHAEEFAIETQKFAQQLATEIASGKNLLKEVSLLKSECFELKVDLERLSDSVSKKESLKEIRKGNVHDDQQFVSGSRVDLDLCPSEDTLHSLSIPGLLSHEPESVTATNLMKANFFELLRELDESKAEREILTRKMDQMEGYYEALIHELEENQKRLLGELTNLRNENSTFLYTISSNQSQMETMRHEMDELIYRYAEERRDLGIANKELERRAVMAEAALKRARLNYSIAVDQLQKDLELLSSQVVSMFETNENLIKESFPEDTQLSLDGYSEEIVHNQNRSCQNENTGVKKQLIGGDMILEDLKQSLHLQEELYKKVEEELCEMHLVNINLDVFSRTLQLTLLEATADSRRTKEQVDQLTQQLKISAESNELLTRKLQNSMDEIQTLNEYKVSGIAKSNDLALQCQNLEAKLETAYSENLLLNQTLNENKASYIAKCDEMTLQKQSLEAKLENVYCENSLLNQTLNECKSSCAVKCNDMTMQIHNLEAKLTSVSSENRILALKFTECEAMVSELSSYKSKYEACAAEITKLMSSLEQKAHENGSLRNEITAVKREYEEMGCLNRNLQNVINSVQDKLVNLFVNYDKQVPGLPVLGKPLNENDNDLKDFMSIIFRLEEFHQNASCKILELMEDTKNLQTERDLALISSCTAESEIAAMKLKCEHDLCNMTNKLEEADSLVQKFQLDLYCFSEKLKLCSETEERSSLMIKELVSGFTSLEVELHEVTLKNNDLAQEISVLETVTDELGRSKLTISESTQKNQSLMTALQEKGTEYTKLLSEFNSVKQELNDERSVRNKFEATVTELTSQINENNEQMCHIKQLVSHVELEKSRLQHLLALESVEKSHKESSAVISLEHELNEVCTLLVAADVNFIFSRSHHESQMEEFHKKHCDVETKLSSVLASEAQYIEGNAKLMMELESLRSELNASIAQNSVIERSKSQVITELEQLKNTASMAESCYMKEQNQHALEIERLNHILTSSEEQIDNLVLSNEELEIEAMLLKAKLDELLLLQNQCNELTQKLADQVIKTEEFKNLSLHFKDLKDQAEAECVQAREKRDQTYAIQESLRIAFIKEQYETKLQELKQQLSISKQHGEEMLWKLQDTINELEKRKKSEASHLHKNEELSMKILELENDMQKVLLDKREKVNACDRIQAELECALISLDCCKEEKEKLEASLLECSDEKTRTEAALASTKDQLMSIATPVNFQEDRKDGFNGNVANYFDREDKENTCSVPINESEHLSARKNEHAMRDSVVSRDGPASPLVDHKNSLQNDSRHLALINDHLKTQSFKSSMDHLHNELEKMKNENLLIPRDAQHLNSNFQGLQREIMQLHKANEELGSIFPSYNQFTVNGNALERVLALEVELAESLRTKNKSNVMIQSCFIKQHSDDEAVFKSFRDINELIKEMLETKNRYFGVETELKEMHDRYSQLSLQFAEVEGERQKLMMTLKNVRTSKKNLLLNRSSSANLADSSP